MEKFQPLLNLEFEEGWQDCFTLLQRYYQSEMGVTVRDYARPSQWFMIPDFDFFERLFSREGFVSVSNNPNDVLIGDTIMMALGRTSVINHVAIYVGRGLILHHLTGQKSRLDSYTGRWKERVKRVVRHPASEYALDSISPEILAQLPYHIRQQMKKKND